MPKHLNTERDYELVEIGRLKPSPYNPNQGDFGAIQESIETNGFFGALVVNRRDHCILAGNHRYAVAKQMGFDRLPVTWVDVDPERAKRILLADNRTARLGNDEPNALAELLSALAQSEAGLAGTGYTGDDLDDLIADLAGFEADPGQKESSDRGLTRSQYVKAVIAVDQVGVFEQALLKTGRQSRAEAVLEIARHYLGSEDAR